MKQKILIVDDDPQIRKAYKIRLEEIGYEVVAKAPNEHKDYLTKRFDILIIDGLEGACFRELKKIKATRKIVVSGDYKIVFRAKENKIETYERPINWADVLK